MLTFPLRPETQVYFNIFDKIDVIYLQTSVLKPFDWTVKFKFLEHRVTPTPLPEAYSTSYLILLVAVQQ